MKALQTLRLAGKSLLILGMIAGVSTAGALTTAYANEDMVLNETTENYQQRAHEAYSSLLEGEEKVMNRESGARRAVRDSYRTSQQLASEFPSEADAQIRLSAAAYYEALQSRGFNKIRKLNEAWQAAHTAINMDPENPRAWVAMGAATRELSRTSQNNRQFFDVTVERLPELEVRDALTFLEVAGLYDWNSQVKLDVDSELARSYEAVGDLDRARMYWTSVASAEAQNQHEALRKQYAELRLNGEL